MVQSISPIRLPAILLAKTGSAEFETCVFNIPCAIHEKAVREVKD